MTNDPLPPLYWQTLSSHRDELDALDAELVSLLARRFSVTAAVGELKAAYAADALDGAREAAQLERLVGLAREHGLPAKVTQRIFSAVFELVRESHRDIAQRRLAAEPGATLERA